MNSARFLQMSGVVVDLVYRVPRVPKAGEEAEVLSFDTEPGGGFNAMMAAGRSGMSVSYGGTLGKGVFADMVVQAMVDADISILGSSSGTLDQGCCVVMIDDDGERTFIAKEGAEGVMSSVQCAAIEPLAFDWILLSGYTLAYKNSRDALKDWLLGLPEGAKLIFDPSPIVGQIPKDIRNAALSAATWVSANAAEASILIGEDDPARAVEILAEKAREGGGAIVRVGPKGCFVAQRGEPGCHIGGFPVETIDTNGAGDTHLGAFAAALSRGETPKNAARTANATAALSTTRHGPATAPTLNEVEAFLASRRNG